MSGADTRAETRILVVRLGSMGDIIHTLPAVATLKHSFPGCRLSWVVEPQWSELLEGNPFIDRLVALNRCSVAGWRESWRELRREQYDFGVDFQGLIKSALAATIARPERIFGFHYSQVREKLAALFYSTQERARAVHVVERNLMLAAAAGATSLLRAFPLPEGRPSAPLPDRRFVLASPFAGWGAKQWPLEHYATLAKRLNRECGMPLVLNGPPGKRPELAAIPGVDIHISGLSGLIDATRRATAIIGVDSGPLHLAAALGCRGVAIFGPTDPARNGPFGGDFTVLRSPRAVTTYQRVAENAWMREISPDMVFAALADRLARRPEQTGHVA
ncbi:MAG: glycosyltransferase family 9 protein [Bryobacteraceae bacterium]